MSYIGYPSDERDMCCRGITKHISVAEIKINEITGSDNSEVDSWLIESTLDFSKQKGSSQTCTG